MNRIIAIAFSLALAGCVTTATNDSPDAFVNAAVSWEGGHIRNMISVWGQPNLDLTEPSAYSNGYAHWLRDDSTAAANDKPNPYAAEKLETTCTGQAVGSYGNVNVNCTTRDKNEIARNSYENGRNARNSFAQAFSMRCEVLAEFDQSGRILKVSASSYLCSSGNEEALLSVTRTK